MLFVAQSMAAITVDGILDEPEWASAKTYDQFVTVEPLTSEPAKYQTQVKVYTDSNGIYIGFKNYQPEPVKRVFRRFPRDSQIDADRNVVGIDFDGTGLSGYDFTVGSANSQQDGLFTANSWSSDWDGTWYSQVSNEGDYWFSEIHIPWTVAPMSAADNGEKTMRMFFSRVVYNESLRFSFPNASFQRPTFIQEWHPVVVKQEKTSTLDFFPYLSYSNDLEQNDDRWKAGIDMVWRPNNSTQVTAAANPDFGQVESDDLVVNFSAFETFRSEKRPFFTENQSLFTKNFPNDDKLINTRRIGAKSDAGDKGVTDIDLAAKFSHFGDKLDYGVFAVTEDDTSISEGRDFFTSRIQAHSDSLSVGHSLTFVDKETLAREVMINAIDMDWRHDQLGRFEAQILQSDIEQDANIFNGFEMLDEADQAAWAKWSYSPSDEWQHSVKMWHYGDAFDMNDMGFMRRNDLNKAEIMHRKDVLQYDDDSSLLTSYSLLRYAYEENTEGGKLALWWHFDQSFTFKSSEVLFFEADYELEAFDDRVTRGNGLYKVPEQYRVAAKYSSPQGDDYSYDIQLYADTTDAEKPMFGLRYSPTLFVTETFTIGAEAYYEYYQEWLLWDFDTTQLATYESEHYSADLRIDWYPSTRQEVRLKFQWVGIRSEAITGLNLASNGSVSDSAIPVADFSVADTALQLRYRYQLAPLSDIFLVYNRGGNFTSNQDESPSELVQQGWDEVGAESIVAKIRYRF